MRAGEEEKLSHRATFRSHRTPYSAPSRGASSPQRRQSPSRLQGQNMSVLRIAMQHESFREPQAPLRPSELYTFAPYQWNPTHLIHFARVGDLPILRRYQPRSFASSLPAWPCRRRKRRTAEPSLPLSSGQVPPPAPSPPAPDPCATETVVKALRALRPDRKSPTAKEGAGGDPSPPAQWNKQRCHVADRIGPLPTSQPRAAKGDPSAPSGPTPDPMEQPSPPLSPGLIEGSTAAASSSATTATPAKRPARNNNRILSSYSSSGGIERLWIEAGMDLSSIKRFMPPTEEVFGWSWKTLMDERKAKKQISAPAKAGKAVKAYIPPQPVELPLSRWIIPPSPPLMVNGRPWRGARLREVRLFQQSKEPLVMPPAVDPGYKITRADYDADRAERQRQFKRGLNGIKDSPPPEDKAPSLPPPPASVSPAAAGSGPPGTEDGQRNEQHGQNLEPAGAPPGAPQRASPLPGPPPPPPPAFPPALPTSAPQEPDGPLSAGATLQPCPPVTPTGVTPASNPAQPRSSLAMPLHSTPKPSILFGMLTSPPGGQSFVATGAAVATPAATTAAGSALFPPVFGSPAQSQNPWGSGGALTPTATPSTTEPPSNTFQPIFGASLPLPASTGGLANAVPPSYFAPQQPSLTPAKAPPVLAAGGFPVFSAPPQALLSPCSGAATMTTISTPGPMVSLGPSGTGGGPPPGGTAQPSLFGAPPGPSLGPPPSYPFGASFNLAPTNRAAPPTATGISATASPSFAAPRAVTTSSPFSPLRPTAFGAKRGASEGTPPPAKVTALGLAGHAAPLSFPGSGANQAMGGKGGGGGGNPPAQTPFGGPSFGGVVGGDSSSISNSPSAQTPFGGVAFGAKRTPQPAFVGGRSSSPPAQNPFGGASFGAKRAPQPAFGSVVSGGGGGSSRNSSSPPAQTSFGGVAFGANSAPQLAIGGQSSAFSFGSAPAGTTITSSAFGMGAQPPRMTSSGGSGVFGGAAPAALFSYGAPTQASPGGPSGSSNSIGGHGHGSSSSATAGANVHAHFGGSGGAAGPSAPSGVPPAPMTWGGFVFPLAQETEKALNGPAGGTLPSFSIGSSGTRTGTRQRFQARRQHQKKKN